MNLQTGEPLWFVLKESLDRLWDYKYPAAMFNYLDKWIDQLKWQRRGGAVVSRPCVWQRSRSPAGLS